MSCLPLFSFSPSIPSAFRPAEGSQISNLNAQCTATSPTTLKVTRASEDLYDKLSQVSVSHRRIDSFEWVMTQSAPNTPPTSDGRSSKPFSPPLERFVTSAPLPVPNELWSAGPRSTIRKPQRGYFDWWPSSSLKNGTGYAMIPDDEESEESGSAHARKSIAGSSRSHAVEARKSTESRPCAISTCSGESDQLRPSQELNALGIVFPDTPSPPASGALKMAEPYVAQGASPRLSAARPPKRVTFSPVIDEVTLESFPDFNEQRPSPWGSYLPSSFLVARPPLPRTTSLPTTQAKIVVRPILRRSISSKSDATRNTEMAYVLPKIESTSTADMASRMPAQRPSVSHSSIGSHSGRDTNDSDKAFAALLQATHKPSRRRCDSLLSNVSNC